MKTKIGSFLSAIFLSDTSTDNDIPEIDSLKPDDWKNTSAEEKKELEKSKERQNAILESINKKSRNIVTKVTKTRKQGKELDTAEQRYGKAETGNKIFDTAQEMNKIEKERKGKEIVDD